MSEIKIPPIKKVISIIDSCINVKQLKTCEKLADFYTTLSKKKGVINYSLVKEILYIKISEKREEFLMTYKFKGKIRRRKIKEKELEYELIENFS